MNAGNRPTKRRVACTFGVVCPAPDPRCLGRARRWVATWKRAKERRAPDMPNLATLLTETARRHAQRPALKLDDTTISYEALDEASARVAGLLQQRGVGAGDRVGIMLPNVPYFAIAYYGVLRAGGVVV